MPGSQKSFHKIPHANLFGCMTPKITMVSWWTFSLSLLIPQASKCRKSNDFTVCTVIRPPKDHIDFFESLDISQETSNTLKKFKETVKISDCWAFRQYEKKNDGVA